MKRAVLYCFLLLSFLSCSKDDEKDDSYGDLAIALDPTSLTIRAGEKVSISATVTPSSYSDMDVLWVSDNTSVAKVSNGVVTGVGAGSTTITAKTKYGSKTAKCKITVLSPILVSSIDFADSEMLVDVYSSSYEIPVTIKPEDATNKSLQWTSSDASVATVVDGVLRIQGKGITTITAKAKDAGGVSQSCDIIVMNVPEAVDMGLSVKWASFNLGAESPEGTGDFYAWGEMQVKETYDVSNYRFSSYYSGPYSKYNTVSSYGNVDNKTTLETVDDIVYEHFHGKWRMPTSDEFDELLNTDNCSWIWTKQNGVSGYKVSSKKTGYTDRSIFLPATGFRQGSEYFYNNEWGLYWTSSLDPETPSSAFGALFDNSDFISASNSRFVGFAIRPVCK